MLNPRYNGEAPIDLINNEQRLGRSSWQTGETTKVYCDSMCIPFVEKYIRAVNQQDGGLKLPELFLNRTIGFENQTFSTSIELSANQTGQTGAGKNIFSRILDGEKSNHQEKTRIEVQV